MGGKVKVQAIAVVKMDKFKYVGQLYKTEFTREVKKRVQAG